MEGQFGIFGLGIYLTKPLADFSKEERIGRWFATLEISAATLSFGGNIAQNKGRGEREWADSNNQFGNQHYAFGQKYDYFHYSTPLRIQFWKEMKSLSVGMFFESEGFIYEQSFDFKTPCAIGYNVTSGLIFKY